MKTQFTANDMISIDRLSGPSVKSNVNINNKYITYHRKYFIDNDNKKGQTQIYLSELDSELNLLSTNELTSNPNITSITPMFGKSNSTANDSIFFLSPRDMITNNKTSTMQICCIDGLNNNNIISDGYSLTSFPLDCENLKTYSGENGTPLIAFTMEVYSDTGNDPQNTINRENENKKNDESSGVVFDKLPLKHWDRLNPYAKRNHVFLAKLKKNNLNNKFKSSKWEIDSYINLMNGLETDCPSKPFNGAEEYDISSDGKFLVYTARPNNIRDFAWTTKIDLFLQEIPSSFLNNNNNDDNNNNNEEKKEDIFYAEPICLTPDNQGVSTSPVFSPDNKKIAFMKMERYQYESDRLIIHIYDLDKKELIKFSDHVDVSFRELIWSTDSNYIYATAQYGWCIRIFRFNTNDGSVSILPGEETRNCIQLIKDENNNDIGLTFLRTNLSSPPELSLIHLNNDNDPFVSFDIVPIPPVLEITPEIDNFQTYQYTSFSVDRSNSIDFHPYEQFYFKGANDDDVQAIYVAPTSTPETLEDKSVPLLLIIHGGPQSAFLNFFHFRWNLQAWAAQGYGCVAINFHGSTGFGQDFTDSIRSNWGAAPMDDLIIGVDKTLERYPYLNPEKVGAAGASYGGYSINWLNGHTKRFKALVNHDGVFDLRAMYWNTEEIWFLEYEMKGKPWDKNEEVQENYRKWSPSTYVDQWRTPCLFIQGGKDYRVCETEAIAGFTTLQRLGIESRFLYFPDENHWILNPKNLIRWHAEIFRWLDHYLKDNETK